MNPLLLVAPLCLVPLQDGSRTDWKPVEPGLVLHYPADHGSHPEYRTEWWYVTGQVEDEGGARFGFQFTLFRRGLETGASAPGESELHARELLAAHLAVTDVRRSETLFAERLGRPSPLAHAAEGDLDLALEGWKLVRGKDDVLTLEARDAERGIGLELALKPTKALVRHGQDGYSRKGDAPGNASEYVSWTRLAVKGRLSSSGETRAVLGSAWYDHEFGSGTLPENVIGWNWFGLQLEGGRELMLFALRDGSGEFTAASGGTLVERDGTTHMLARKDFTLSARRGWTSPRNGATYPSRWTLELPDHGLVLEVATLVADCELSSQATTGVCYWEGPVEVSGTLAGHGYAELTGYAGSMKGRF